MLSLIKYIYQQSWNKDASPYTQNERSNSVKNCKEEKDVSDEEVFAEFEDVDTTDVALPTEMELAQLRREVPDIFLSNQRNLVGYVLNEQDDGTLELGADSKRLDVVLAEINSECRHEVGDRINVRCFVKIEELFPNEKFEKFVPLSLAPANKRKHQKCKVASIKPERVILDNGCFISKRVLDDHADKTLKVGDILYVDMIQNRLQDFQWRCTYFTPAKSSEFVHLPRRNPSRRHAPNAPEQSQRLIVPKPKPGRWNNYQNKLCKYANQVWSQEIGEFFSGASRQVHRRFKAVRMPAYEIPSNIRTTYLTHYNSFFGSDSAIDDCFSCLEQDLSFDNYVERFQLLLWLDEVELFKNFRQYDDERKQLKADGDCFVVTISNLGERRPSLVIGDKVRVYIKYAESAAVEAAINQTNQSNKANQKCFEGIIFHIGTDTVSLKFHHIFHETYRGEDCRLEFYFSRVNFRRKHFAINRAVQNLGREFLFPERVNFHDRPQLDIRLDAANKMTYEDEEDIIEWYNPNLNHLQRGAVFNILRGEANMPYIIYGPPGTGKTVTLIECILQLVTNLPRSRLLVATPSNSAANLLCSRLIESQGLHLGEMVRLVSHNLVERDQIPENLLPFCATADLGEDGTHEDEMFVAKGGLKLNCPMHMMSRFRVTVSTCSTVGKYLECGFNRDHFTHVLIDEAGQCSEPDIMVAITQVAKTRGQVILAGDPGQLNAIVINQYANSKGLKMSFLERIMNMEAYRKNIIHYGASSGYNPILITKLCHNYRSLPSIIRIYDYLFYDLELKSTISTTDSEEVGILKRLANTVLFRSPTRPIAHGTFFYAISGRNVRDADSPSWYNPREANVIFNTALEIFRCGMKPDDIGIISPYVKQVRFIRALFNKAKLVCPKIGSVEEFQGQERQIILLSTVRTARREVNNYDARFGLGFVKSERRFNVAVSRARALLIIFGDSKLLRSDECWSVYMGDCSSNDSYFGRKIPDLKGIPTNDEDDENHSIDKNDDELSVATATE